MGWMLIKSECKEQKNIADRIMAEIELTESYSRYLEGSDVGFVLAKAKETGRKSDAGQEVVLSTVSEDVKNLDYFFKRFYFKGGKNAVFYERVTRKIHVGKALYNITFYYNLSLVVRRIHSVFWPVVFVYMCVSLFVLIEGRADNKKILSPLRDMTETAKHLTANNLSERIHVGGPQDELRELAQVINEMLDRLQLSYESQKQFVSNASHELRTPIAVIQGYSEMLVRWGAEDPDILKESIEAIDSESKSMKELVEKLLFLSRHDRKSLKLERQNFQMDVIINELAAETRMVAKNRIINTPEVEKITLYGDAQLMKQAVRVFMDNAVKYTVDGDSISLSCKRVNGNCVITVEDTGIGMKQEDVAHVFDRFFRADDARNRNIEGHGLGLSIAKLIVDSHYGAVRVRSQLEKGTVFTIIIPIQNIKSKLSMEVAVDNVKTNEEK
ncbi:MAG: HAMP domain-containing histidine kinase [Lachnospiraceae bacterium]|nr:HAMP domain-containing histidine kinase [Lachnospiraceae bacterium]